MYTTLFAQQWKKTIRSRYFSQGWGIKILLGFLIIYFGASFLLLGFFMPEILREAYPNQDLVTPVFSQFLLYYMLADLAMRFFLQDLNVLSVQHYLLQPIRKSRVINFLLAGSIFNFFNLFPLVIVVPFMIRGVIPEYGALTGITWLAAVLGLILTDHFLAIYVKRVIAVKQVVFFIFIGILALLFTTDAMEWLSLQDISAGLFQGITETWFFVIPLLITSLIYLVNYYFLRRMAYLDRWTSHRKEAASQEFTFLESRGAVGTMMANELKLIMRNKRTKSVLWITLLFSAYGLLFYTNPEQYGMGWLVFVGIFMTGIFMINYGQFMVGWESAYFDGILTRAYPMEAFFRAKFWLLVSSSVVTYIISLAYVYFTLDAFWINTASFLFNVGFNTFVLLYASTYQKKRIDLSRSSAFNYQGTSAVQFVIVLPLMLLPVLIYQGFALLGFPYYGLGALAAVGLLSLAFSKLWFREIIKNFKEKKYRNAAGFREA